MREKCRFEDLGLGLVHCWPLNKKTKNLFIAITGTRSAIAERRPDSTSRSRGLGPRSRKPTWSFFANTELGPQSRRPNQHLHRDRKTRSAITKSNLGLHQHFSTKSNFFMGCSKFIQNPVRTNGLCFLTKFDVIDSMAQLKFLYRVVTTKIWVPLLMPFLTKIHRRGQN